MAKIEDKPSLPESVVAIEAFLSAMRREYLARYPGSTFDEVRVPVWDQMEPDDQGIVMRSMRAALTAANQERRVPNSRVQETTN